MTDTDLFAFMKNSPDGKYEVTKPTNEQFAAVLPWLINQTVTWAQKNGHCATVNDAIANLTGESRRNGVTFYAANGLDCYGRNRDGFDENGYDQHGYDKDGYNSRGHDQHGYDKDGYNSRGYDQYGYNKDGYSRYGYDKDGFDVNGVDQWGKTRAQAVAKLVGGWTKEHLAMVAAKLRERQAAAKTVAAEAEAEEPAAEADLVTAA